MTTICFRTLAILAVMLTTTSTFASNLNTALSFELSQEAPPEKIDSPDEAVLLFFDVMSIEKQFENEAQVLESLFNQGGGVYMPYLKDLNVPVSHAEMPAIALKFMFAEAMKQQEYREQIKDIQFDQYHRVAQARVVTEATIQTESGPQTNTYLTYFQLIKSEDGWKITSVLREIENPEQPIPKK